MKFLMLILGLGAISIVITSLMVLGGYTPLQYILTNVLVGGTLGYVSGRLGYEF